jgi:NAD-dependent SIR2 family protein deacetylase
LHASRPNPGVPDYRSPQGAYSTGFKPMTHQQFLASPTNRARYWARSFYGWQRFAATQPNAAHLALAELEQRVGYGGGVRWVPGRTGQSAGDA